MLRSRTKHARGISAAYICALCVSGVFSAGISGCTINPTPRGYAPDAENPGKLTFAEDISAYIAEKARCELRDAFVALAANLIDGRMSAISSGELARNPGLIRGLQIWDIEPVAQVRSSLITSSTFKMDFKLDTSESNNQGVSVGLLTSAGNPALTLAIPDHTAQLSRQNERTFEFPAMKIGALQSVDCFGDPKPVRQPNFAYPATGRIGLAKTAGFFANFLQIGTAAEEREVWARRSLSAAYVSTISTEIDRTVLGSNVDRIINRLEDAALKLRNDSRPLDELMNSAAGACYKIILGRAADLYNFYYYQERGIGNSPSVVSDIITFTTSLSGGINPKLAFLTNKALDIESAGYSLTNGRIDSHKITIKLTQADPFSFTEKETSEVVLAAAGDLKLAVKKEMEVGKNLGVESNCLASIGAGDPLLEKKSQIKPPHKNRKSKVRVVVQPKPASAPTNTGPFIGQTPNSAADEAAKERIDRSLDVDVVQDALRRLTK